MFRHLVWGFWRFQTEILDAEWKEKLPERALRLTRDVDWSMAQPYFDRLNELVDTLGLTDVSDARLEVEHFFNAAILRVNERTCVSLTEAGIAFKVGEQAADRLIRDGAAREFRYYPAGRAKAGYALILLRTTTEELRILFSKAIELAVSS
jgi:hypothetical protein